MTLSDIELPPSVEFCQNHALVFTPQLAARLAELHAEYGRPDCIAMPRQLTDGRLMLPATLLYAIQPGGWLHGMWEAADKAMLLPAVEVIPWSEAVALLPPETPMPVEGE
jgi:hypothetical protein